MLDLLTIMCYHFSNTVMREVKVETVNVSVPSDEGKDEDRKIAQRKCKVVKGFLAIFEGEYREIKHVYWLETGTCKQKD